jgi:endonuclease YncB( thermonuclease family)
MYKWNCRLTGVDTPELRTSNQKEKEYGYVVRDLLREKILNKVVQVECDDLDKYGRLLTVIYIDGENVNQWLIDNDYAFAYDGGTKRSWEEYLENKTKE